MLANIQPGKMLNEENTIKAGDYVVIQRQNFTKLHKLKANGTVCLGKDQVELENVIGKPYFSTFRMIIRPKNKRVYSLEVSDFINSIQNVTIDKSGVDNRDIVDDGQSQQLTKDDILKLRDEELCSSNIVEKLINNSKTFGAKTEYSQEKYLKKKEKKYFEYIQVRKPSLRLISEIYYRQDPGKVQGIRIDDLSQILCYANVQDDSKILLYDSGTSGLLAAAVTNCIGQNTGGVLIHMHPGNVCQKEAFLALKFQEEQTTRCINVCLYSVLRCFYQEMHQDHSKNKQVEDELPSASVSANSHSEQPSDGNLVSNKRKLADVDFENKPAKRPCWQIDNERACKILAGKMDGLIIAAKEHPSNIVKELLSFLGDGKPLVVYSLLRESLESLYVELKNRTDIISLRLSSTMMRNYQVLSNRTHPDVNMTCGGYVLSGFKVSTKSD